MKRLRFGVIGCGGISTLFQLPALRRSKHVDLVAVADTDYDHARTVARRFKVPHSYADYRDMIGQIDTALVATPNATHAEITCSLLERDINVLCEKPMATSVADVDRMQDTARRSGTRLMAAHSMRFGPHMTMLKQIVDDGWLGSIREISGALGAPYSAGVHRTDFRKQQSLSGGGVLMDLGVHLIDLALWLTGDTPRSAAYHGSASPGWNVESNAETAIAFTGGTRAFLYCSFTDWINCTVSVKGEAGWARAPAYDPTKVFLFVKRARICQRTGFQQLVLSNSGSDYDRQIDHFCTAVLTGTAFRVRDDEIRMGMQIIEKCYSTPTLKEAAFA